MTDVLLYTFSYSEDEGFIFELIKNGEVVEEEVFDAKEIRSDYLLLQKLEKFLDIELTGNNKVIRFSKGLIDHIKNGSDLKILNEGGNTIALMEANTVDGLYNIEIESSQKYLKFALKQLILDVEDTINYYGGYKSQLEGADIVDFDESIEIEYDKYSEVFNVVHSTEKLTNNITNSASYSKKEIKSDLDLLNKVNGLLNIEPEENEKLAHSVNTVKHIMSGRKVIIAGNEESALMTTKNPNDPRYNLTLTYYETSLSKSIAPSFLKLNLEIEKSKENSLSLN